MRTVLNSRLFGLITCEQHWWWLHLQLLLLCQLTWRHAAWPADNGHHRCLIARLVLHDLHTKKVPGGKDASIQDNTSMAAAVGVSAEHLFVLGSCGEVTHRQALG